MKEKHMSAYKTLIIAIDLEGGYEHILKKAADFIDDQETKVIVLNVGHFPIPSRCTCGCIEQVQTVAFSELCTWFSSV